MCIRCCAGHLRASGFSISRGLELSWQWEKVIIAGPMGPLVSVTLENPGLEYLFSWATHLLAMFDTFAHKAVTDRRDHSAHLYRWLRADLIPPSPFLVCPHETTAGRSGMLVDPGEIYLRFQQTWSPFCTRASRKHARVDECLRECGEWLPTLEEITLPVLTGEMLFDAVHAESPFASGLMRWQQSWLLSKNLGFGPITCWMLMS